MQNRVTPTSDLMDTPHRGLVYGNRGCLHDANGNIVRFQQVQRWIACRLEFKGRKRRPLMAPGKYTELFFLDEATAFAAGHRPCAECRREDYVKLKARWGGADAIDARLAGERLEGTRRRLHTAAYADLPDGAFVIHDSAPYLVRNDALRPWTPAGYGAPIARPTGNATLLTPPSLTELLTDGWSGNVPFLHPTAGGRVASP